MSDDDDDMMNQLFSMVLDDDDGADEVAMMMADDSSDEDEGVRKWGGSGKGKAPNKERNFAEAFNRLTSDYFSGPESIYNETDFERRFRMPRSVFNKIEEKVIGKGSFKQQKDCTGKLGIHPLCRLTACLRVIGYGDPTDREDEYLRMSETTVNDSVKEFTRLVVDIFGPQYLNRCPTAEEKTRILRRNKRRGWPGLFASWDCKHFVWKSCPVVLAGQHKGHAEGGKKTLILEGLADSETYLWYANFGDAGSLNDINVLDKSSIVGAMMSGLFDIKVPDFDINCTTRDWFYFLADGIYPDWAIFAKTFSHPADAKQKEYTKQQEFARKEVERTFGVIVQQFIILKNPLRFWYMKDIINLLHCCVIFHNMIVEERRGGYDVRMDDSDEEEDLSDAAGVEVTEDRPKLSLFGHEEVDPEDEMREVIAKRTFLFSQRMFDKEEHRNLKADLIEHMWARKQRAGNQRC